MNKVEVETIDFDVIGAGILRLSKGATSICGGKQGFSIYVSWGQNGIKVGGVISREEAYRLAKHIAVQLKMDLI